MAKEKIEEPKKEIKDTKELYRIQGTPSDFRMLFDTSVLDKPFIKDLSEGKAVEVDKSNKLIKILIDNKIIVKE